jgi:protein O-GlcNAc transferase
MAKLARRLPDHVKNGPSALELVLQGNVLRRAGETVRAADLYRQATQLDAGCTDAWSELGCCLMENEQHASEAVSCFHRVLGSFPSEPRASDGSEQSSEIPQEAIQLLARIVAGRVDWITGQLTLGCAYGTAGQHELARAHLANALQLDPSLQAPVQSMFAAMYYKEQKWPEAIAAVDCALAAGTHDRTIWFIRSSCCIALARVAEGVESARRGIKIARSPALHSSLLYAMNFLEETTPELLCQEACQWNSWYAAPLAKRIHPHTNHPDPERRIKVGYISPDLHNHAVMKFVPQVFAHHDRSRFEVFVYAMGAKSDDMTEELRKSIENYRRMPASDSELAERVRADGIDILVDLSGHTQGSSLLAFAEKPAPVQVSWIGMLSTTGLTAMDYFLGDAHMPCPGTEPAFSETVYRLPVLCSYRPFANVPIAPPPCLENGYITFGSFNSPRKITREVAKLWSAILHLVPGSRLLLKYGGLDTEAMQERFYPWFMEDGIPPERLRFEGAVPAREYLEAFRNIDIALDPFPYNGGSTTLDTLWMGVPVVTLAGRLAVQCTGTSVLTAIGLPDLVAKTPEQYLNVALHLAVMVANMPNLRQDVRQSMLSSPIMDEIGQVRHLENAYRDMWRKWCQTRS